MGKIESATSDVPLPHRIQRPSGMLRVSLPGRPRNGQWVLVDGDRVGIHAPPPQGSPQAAKIPPGHFLVHFVNTLGFTCQQEVVEFVRIEPLLDKSFIPAARRATQDPQWNPRP